MADDIDELLDEVESKFIGPGTSISDRHSTSIQSFGKKINDDGTEELDAAIHSICCIPDPVGPSLSRPLQMSPDASRKCTVLFVGGNSVNASASTSNISHRKNSQRRQKQGIATKMSGKRYFEKPVFELSVKDLEAESARRKQKERVEILFEKKLATVTDKMILDVRKFKRIKSDVWSNFGDVRLLISEEDAKRYNIDYHVIHFGTEEMLLCKTFVACVKCSAVFSYESHAYGTSTLRSHLKSCGKPRYNMKEKKVQLLRQKRFYAEIVPMNSSEAEAHYPTDGRLPMQEKMWKFRDQATELQEQIMKLFISKLKPFDLICKQEFKTLLQTFVQIGAGVGNADVKNFLCSQSELTDTLLQQTYSTCEAAFKEEVSYQYGLAFSTEIWMDVVEKISFISLTCHYANNVGLFKSVVLFTSEFPYEQKNHEDLTSLFAECIRFMNLEHCRKIIVVDYSFNMVTAFEKDYEFLQCICYSVSRAVQTVINQLCLTDNEDDMNALAAFASLINQCRSLVTHFRQNKLQTTLPKYLVMCASTCWKSTLEMLQSINDQWDHIADVLVERGELEAFAFDHELLSLVVDFLEIFRDGWEELSSLSSPTLNLVLPWISRWQSHCLKIEDESPFLASLKSHMGSAISEEVVTRVSIYHKVATLLDPRFKDFLMDDDYDKAKEQAILMVDQCITTTLQQNALSETGQSATDLFDFFANTDSSKITAAAEVERFLVDYFIMSIEDLDKENKFNPLKYWVENQMSYPNLSKVALWLLSCPAGAVRNTDAILTDNWMINVKESEVPSKHLHTGMFIKSFKNL